LEAIEVIEELELGIPLKSSFIKGGIERGFERERVGLDDI